MNWYVLYTSPRAEKKVAERIEQSGIEVFLPLHLCPRKWSDRIKYVEIPLFSSYVFVKTTDEILRTLLQIYGVSRIVYYLGKPAIVREKEIEAIKSFVEKAKGKECEFSYDDEVQIATGPFKNIKAKVMKTEREQLFLKVEQIGIIIKIKSDQVIKKIN
jgi:transcription antitermination factor NusG